MGSAQSALAAPVLVVSPHLDDAILSLGMTIARAVRSGAQVDVLTVFAGDPASARPASGWDRRAGFTTEGEAATARRAEDLEACRAVGAAPVWLPFAPGSYGDSRDPDRIWPALVDAAAHAHTVLVPGFPLRNDDHSWLAELFLDRGISIELVRYAEQPYLYGARTEGRRPGDAWTSSGITFAGYRLKRRAVLAYRSQLPLLGLTHKLNRLLLHEILHGGEALLRARATAT